MSRVTSKKISLLVLLLMVIAGSILTWIALETSYGQQKIAEYRAWCLSMWNSGIFHIMGGLIVFGALVLLGGGKVQSQPTPSPKKKDGPLGGSAFTEAMLMGRHYDDPVKRKAARKRGALDTLMRGDDL